ncbi:MAG: transglycosylase SLT domain-containing protein [Pseudomonadota bacterium]|nr:transglycosylase SLT domain-containing protein [Pseudomonadota bacterium]
MRLILILTIFLFPFNYLESSELDNCSYFTEKYSKVFNLPNKLLTSISLVESGIKREKNTFRSWPWTLNVSGKSMYFNSKIEILKYLKENINKKKSIDIGCMQINVRYHLRNFESLSHMVDPEENVKYAATFLLQLFKKHRSWNEAISRYHSSVPIKKKRYLKKVYAYWKDLRQRKIKVVSNSNEIEKIKYFRNILAQEKI